MKKIVLAIFGMALLLTSCNKGNPILPGSIVGQWIAQINDDDIVSDTQYVLFAFEQNGNITFTRYTGDTESPVKYWERIRRHGVYTMDTATSYLTFEVFDGKPDHVHFVLTEETLTLSQPDDPKATLVLVCHRPSPAEIALLSLLDHSVWSDDYVGSWLGKSTSNGATIYELYHFDDEFTLELTRYVDKGNECTRTKKSHLYSDEETSEDGEYRISIRNIREGVTSTLFDWELDGKNLVLHEVGTPEEDATILTPVSQADLALLAQLDAKVK